MKKMKKITFLIFLLLSFRGFSQPTTQPTITGFAVPAKLMGDAPFAITPPTSNSTGEFTYVSNNTNVATISGSTITVVGVGTSTITANQAADGTYTSGSTTALFTVTFPPPMDAAPTPFYDDTQFTIINCYSSAYPEIPGTDWNPNLGQTTVATEILVAGNATRKMTNLNYQGVQFAAPLNVSTMNILHLDIWTPDCTTFKVYLISDGGLENSVTLAPELSGWNSFEIPLSDYIVPNLAAITKLKFESVTPGKVVYLDNIFFFKFPSVIELPSLPIDFELSTLTYRFNDFDGGTATKIANPYPSGINTSAYVAKMIKGAGEVYAGSSIEIGTINFSEKHIFKVKVFSPRVGAQVNLYISGISLDPDGNTNGYLDYRTATTTVANTWEELTFVFNPGPTTDEIYRLIFVFDDGTAGDGSDNYTFLVDDIRLIEASLNVATFEASNIRIFPNPTSTVFKIEANDMIENVSLYNVLGQEVLAKTSNSKSVTLDIAHLQTGVYLVKTVIGGVASTSRLVKN